MTRKQVEEEISRMQVRGIRECALTLTRGPRYNPQGEKVKTPFGNCELLNIKELPNGCAEVAFMVSLAQLEKWLKKKDAK